MIISIKSRLIILFTIANLISMNAAYAEPHSTASKNRFYYEKRGDIVWEVPTDRKVIAFTFDDGPDPNRTPAILALLKQYQAKATFFVLGSRVEKFPNIVKQASLDGHEIGNHSFDHASFQGLSRTKMLSELQLTQNAIYNATGQKATLFRPPGGNYNETSVSICKENELLMILWSWDQDTRDWISPSVDSIVNSILNNVHHGDIILMHDFVYKGSNTIEALEIVLPELTKRGYSFVTVSELLSNKDLPGKHIEVSE
ncbi:polysaccharide deacetylase family protein [Paenibacillus sp. CMAA1364]